MFENKSKNLKVILIIYIIFFFYLSFLEEVFPNFGFLWVFLEASREARV
jgi:hypothetical protein